MNRLSLTYIANKLDLKKNSSVKAWCARNGIQVHKDGRANYVWENEFNVIYLATYKKSAKLATPKKEREYIASEDTRKELNSKFARIIAESIKEDQANGPIHFLQQAQDNMQKWQVQK